MLESIILMIVTGSPHTKNLIKLIWCPSFIAIPATTTFADEAIKLPLPPNDAPIISAHQIGRTASLPPISASIERMIGTIVAANGILSIKHEIIEADHKNVNISLLTTPPVTSTKA